MDVDAKAWLIAFCMGVVVCAHADSPGGLREKVWNHGSRDCPRNSDPAIEVFRVDPATYILRQNKCVHFEAPFIYVLFGEHTVFVQDTGATAEGDRFPLYDVVQRLIDERGKRGTHQALKLLVTHSHSHGDHIAGDAQFRGKAGVTLVEPTTAAVRGYFKFAHWPEGIATIDLGARKLTVIPAPGHQDESLAVYDSATQWLLTGDSLYPGRLYVRDWAAYKSSVRRLVEFSKTHRVSAVMGTHIEMSRTPGKLFAVGSTYQPDEVGLPLGVADLLQLDELLQEAGEKPEEIATAKFVVVPVGVLQQVIGKILKAVGMR